jgi:membrane protein implicated in regulation of membrane protease activity
MIRVALIREGWIVDFVFQVCAAIGATLIVCQFLMSLSGLGGDHADGDAGHAGGDHGGGADHHGGPGDEHSSTWIFGELTLRTISASLAFFGLTGMAARSAQAPDIIATLLAVAAGLGAFFVVSWLFRFVHSLNTDGTVSIEQARDRMAKVYVAIPGAMKGAGKIQVEIAGRTLEYKAQTLGGPIATGTPVRIIDLLGHDTVEVVPIVDPPPSAPPPAGGSECGFTGSR